MLLNRIVALALPPRCPACGAIVEADHRFCQPCWSDLHFLAPPWCARCQHPFAFDRGDRAQCARCLAEPPRHDGVRAAVAYGDTARMVALQLKYGRRLGHADSAARLMARHVPGDADMLVPVPLHRWRLWSRGFNQAALIAERIARRTDIPARPDLVRRVRATPPLREMGHRQRAKIVAGAFTLAPGGAARVRGRHVVLVDDVYTSGATSDACVALLKRHGAARVIILCWARVLARDGAD